MIRSLKKGFSLLEIAIIMVIVGILFFVTTSIIRNNTSNLEITKTQNRLQQAYRTIVGTAKYNGLLPVLKADFAPFNPGISGPLAEKFAEIFENMSPQVDGFGNEFVYIYGNTKNVTHWYGDIPTRNTLCTVPDSDSFMQIHFVDRGVTINNVAFIVFTKGKNLVNDITYTGNGTAGSPRIVTINRNNANFDDNYIYMTMQDIKQELKCGERELAEDMTILTESLSTQDNRFDSKPWPVATATTITNNFIYTNKVNNRWCVSVAPHLSPGSELLAKDHIQAFPVDGRLEALSNSIPINPLDRCQNEADFTTDASYALQMTLNQNITATMTRGEYYYYVYALDATPNLPAGTQRTIDRRVFKMVVPY